MRPGIPTNTLWFSTTTHDLRWYSNNSRAIGNVINYDSIGSNLSIVANNNSSDNLGSGTNKNIVAKNWTVIMSRANRNLVFNNNVTTRSHGAAYHDPLAMAHHKSWSKFGSSANNALTANAVNLIKNHLQRSETPIAAPLHKTIYYHCRSAIS